MRRWTALFFTWICLGSILEGVDGGLQRDQFYIGPEWSRAERTKGETHMHGDQLGVRFGYDRLKRYKWYLGVEANYANGLLKGYGFQGEDRVDLKARLITLAAEGRIGYTFQQKECWQFAFTPFVGGGYFTERTNFTSSSPLPVHFKIYYPYVTTGFLAWAQVCERGEVGFNLKARYPLTPKCRVSHDPEEEPVTQRVAERWQFRLEMPFTYRLTCDGQFCVGVNPFYEWRHYGSHPNYPFDFLKTRLRLWGIVLEFIYRM